jgi:hypothetical protein
VAGQVGGLHVLQPPVGVELVHVLGRDVELGHPVHPESTASSARYSSASSPTAEALTRIGRSLLTTVTRRPSAARFLATARIRVSLSPSRKPAGSASWVGVVELDPQGAARR